MKLQARTLHALCAPGQHTAKRRRKCTKQSRYLSTQMQYTKKQVRSRNATTRQKGSKGSSGHICSSIYIILYTNNRLFLPLCFSLSLESTSYLSINHALISPCGLGGFVAHLVSWPSVVRGNWTRVVLFCCILGCLLFLICIEFVYLYFPVLFC